MPKTDSITQARLKELLHYDPETGLLTWLQRAAQRIHIGDVAGSYNSDGYIVIKIDGVNYLAHRLIFLYMLGYIPNEVDHDDHVHDNNRWTNLNAATSATNGKNWPLRSNNTSGHCGVYRDGEKWKVSIYANKKSVFLGRFTELSDAIAARQAAEIKYGFHNNHGSAKSNSLAKPEVR